MTNYFEQRADEGFRPRQIPNNYEARPLEEILAPEEVRMANDFLEYMRSKGFPGARVIENTEGDLRLRGYLIGQIRDLRSMGTIDPQTGIAYSPTPSHLYTPTSAVRSGAFALSDTSPNHDYAANLLLKRWDGLGAYLCEDASLRNMLANPLPPVWCQIDLTLPPQTVEASLRELKDIPMSDGYQEIRKPAVALVAEPATLVEVLEHYAQAAS